MISAGQILSKGEWRKVRRRKAIGGGALFLWCIAASGCLASGGHPVGKLLDSGIHASLFSRYNRRLVLLRRRKSRKVSNLLPEHPVENSMHGIRRRRERDEERPFGRRNLPTGSLGNHGGLKPKAPCAMPATDPQDAEARRLIARCWAPPDR